MHSTQEDTPLSIDVTLVLALQCCSCMKMEAPHLLLGRHGCRDTIQTRGLLRIWLTKGKRSSTAHRPPNSDVCCVSCSVLQFRGTITISWWNPAVYRTPSASIPLICPHEDKTDPDEVSTYLVDSKGGIDASSIDLLTLLV